MSNSKHRAVAVAGILIILVAIVAGTWRSGAYEPGQDRSQTDAFLRQTGESLISLHQQSRGGWRFKSQIQAPHYQTDRDVGAAGIGMGFLALADAYPRDPHWITAAENTANWLTAVSTTDENGRYWHDYIDDSQISSDVYTSFDDGAIGIGDFFWQLYEKTHTPEYKKVALESLRWTLSQAQPYDSYGIHAYRWKWDESDKNSPYYTGMGEGAAGLTYALAVYYERLRYSDPQIADECKKYMLGSLNYLDIVQHGLAENTGNGQALPETGVAGQTGDSTLNSGYLSGNAGDAFMYLKLYQVFGNKSYLAKAEKLLGWLHDTKNGLMVITGPNSVAWQLSLDSQGGNVDSYASGMEEGAAGIGWVFLQAYGQTHRREYLDTAKAAGNWLLNIAVKNDDGGLSWREDEHPPNELVHANLNNGAAGIGLFLQDLYLATGQSEYLSGAQGAQLWLKNSAVHNGSHGQYLYWDDNGGNDSYSDDPSWHWGLAGIIEFGQRMKGGGLDMPSEEPGLSPVFSDPASVSGFRNP